MRGLTAVRQVRITDYIEECNEGSTNPAKYRGDDGKTYVVKRGVPTDCVPNGRPFVADHLVGRLGARIGAPCATVVIAVVPEELRRLHPEKWRYAHGGNLTHAHEFIDGVRQVWDIIHTDTQENRARFASILVLYSWTLGSDYQFLYEIEASQHRVYTYDHGTFLGGEKWREEYLRRSFSPEQLDERLMTAVKPTARELQAPRDELESVTEDEIREVVMNVPKPWWGPLGDASETLVQFLRARQARVLELISGLS